MENLEEVLPKILEMGVRVQLGSGTASERWRAVFVLGRIINFVVVVGSKSTPPY